MQAFFGNSFIEVRVRAKWLPSCPALCDPMNGSLSAPLSMGFSRQESWNGLSCFPSGDLPDPGIRPMPLMSPALAGRFFTSAPPGKPLLKYK